MAVGPGAGLKLVDDLGTDDRLAADHRLHAVRGHLLEMTGDPVGARAAYLAAAQQTTSTPQQRYLLSLTARLDASAD